VCSTDPSLTEVSLPAAKVTVGATLFTVTNCVSAAPVSLSESVADAETVELFGPSANEHWNEPFVLLNESELESFEPVPEQLVVTDVTVS
jgi:hypothetical protein